MSLQTDGVNLSYFRRRLPNRISSLKYLRYTTLGCIDIKIRKLEFVAKTQLVSYNFTSVSVQKSLLQRTAVWNIKFNRGKQQMLIYFPQAKWLNETNL